MGIVVMQVLGVHFPQGRYFFVHAQGEGSLTVKTTQIHFDLLCWYLKYSRFLNYSLNASCCEQLAKRTCRDLLQEVHDAP
jgi:hypothetical protein